jgi:cell division transport system permease protein
VKFYKKMFWTNTKRIIRSGFVNFWRNGFVSLSSILIMVVTLFVIGSVIFVSATFRATLTQLKNEVDISVYFYPTAVDSDILAFQSTLEKLPEVATVSYVSADQALQDFTARHQNDELTLQSLQELGNNPLGASLIINAKDPSDYADIASFLQSDSALAADGTKIIDTVSYNEHQSAINTLVNIINSSEQMGLGLIVLLIALSVLITFNTIRLTIYVSRDEIAVMRLVGASNKYVRGPFVVSGVLYGLISGLITLALFWPITLYLQKYTASFFTGIDLFHYYLVNFGQIFIILVGAGIIVGALSSWLAVRRYLRV